MTLDFDTQVKLAIYQTTARTGQPPSAVALARQSKHHAFLPVGKLIDAWCRAHDMPRRPIVRMDQLWRLAVTWYASRLEAESRRPAPEEMRRIFEAIGLQGEFWDPSADNFV